ncbi:MAG: dual specificity protein phosphatase family protein [Bryobacterales bacterium]|nr:dual specificity protein phosphatase family protein [Bryobacterales bacterium]
MSFLRFPIPDRQTPKSVDSFSKALESLDLELKTGRNVVVHCRQGIGRSGLMAACLLVANGADPDTAVRQVSAVRGVPVPETPEQRDWINRYAASLAEAHHD